MVIWKKFPENRNDIPYKGDIVAAPFSKDGELTGEIWRLRNGWNFNHLNYKHLTHWMSWNDYKNMIQSHLKD